MTHPEIEQQEIIERYVRRQLSAAEGTAFEEHFFACDECFDKVQVTERFVAGMKDAAVTGVLARQSSESLTATDYPSWFGWLKPAVLVTATASLILVLAVGWLLLRKIPAMRDELARGRQQVEQARQEDQKKLEAAEKQLQSERDARAKLENQLQQKTQGTQQNQGTPDTKTEGNRPQLARKAPPAASETEASEAEATRSTNNASAGASLGQVKRIYVESSGDESFSSQVRAQLVRNLQSSKRFIVTDKKEEADAVLKVSTREMAGGKAEGRTGSMSVRLVNANGRVIWVTANRRKYSGLAADIAIRIVTDLLDAIQKAERKK